MEATEPAQATEPAPRSESPVESAVHALESAMPSSVLKKTVTLGNVTEHTNGRSSSPSKRRAHGHWHGKPKEMLLSKQQSFMDHHGRSVRGRQNLKLQMDQKNWTAEQFIANQAELPKHLSVGTRVDHAGRGSGTVVNAQRVQNDVAVITVEFDLSGEMHTYKASAWKKLALLPEHHELGAALVGMVQRGEFRMVQKMEQDGKFDPTPERAAAEAAQRGGNAVPELGKREWLTQTDALGWTALHWVIAEGRFDAEARDDFIQLLLGAKALANQETQQGNTPLILASRYARPGCTKALLDAKAEVDARNRSGATALHAAAVASSAECVELLLEAKADVLLTLGGKTSLQLAKERRPLLLADAQAVRARARLVLDRQAHSKAAAGKGGGAGGEGAEGGAGGGGGFLSKLEGQGGAGAALAAAGKGVDAAGSAVKAAGSVAGAVGTVGGSALQAAGTAAGVDMEGARRMAGDAVGGAAGMLGDAVGTLGGVAARLVPERAFMNADDQDAFDNFLEKAEGAQKCKELLRAAEELVKGPSDGRKNLDLLKGATKLKMGGARAFAAAADLTKVRVGVSSNPTPTPDPYPNPKPKP